MMKTLKKIVFILICFSSLCLLAQRGPRGDGSRGSRDFQRSGDTPRTVGDVQQAPQGDDRLISALLINSPFGGTEQTSVSEKLGVSLRSAAFVEGEWRFSLVNKDGRSVWLGVNEENEVFSAKITDFDQRKMAVQVLVNGRIHELSLDDRASFANRRISLNDGLIPDRNRPRTPEERRNLWEHASDAQKLEVNKIHDTARSQNRRLSREEFRRIMEIENSIKAPDSGGAQRGGAQSSAQSGQGARR